MARLGPYLISSNAKKISTFLSLKEFIWHFYVLRECFPIYFFHGTPKNIHMCEAKN
jgi:hypothetical protein